MKIKRFTQLLNKTILVLFTVFMASCQSELTEPCPEKTQTVAPVAEEEPSSKSIKEKLVKDGFQIFDFVDQKTKDTVLMQQYFIAFLKRGPNRSQTKEAADSIQKLHMEHLGRMYEEGYADISGPFGDDGDIRGITIYNVPTLKIADSLANMDPAVTSGRLVIEVHPWWAAKGFPLR